VIESVAQFYRVAEPVANITALSSGVVEVGFTNGGRHSFTVLAATNLATAEWNVIGSATNIGGVLYRFTDGSATNDAQRFYQLRTP
jgi:hypothetical protein